MQNNKPRRRTLQGTLCSDREYNRRHYRKYHRPSFSFSLPNQHQAPEPPKPEEPTPPEKQIFSSITFREPLSEEKARRLRAFMKCEIYLLHHKGVIALALTDKGTIHLFMGPDFLVEEIQTGVGLHCCPFILKPEETVAFER